MGLKKDIDKLFEMIMDLEARQKKGERITKQEYLSLKSLVLTLESIGESMLPEYKRKKNEKF